MARKVLVVEDDHAIREALISVLELEGYDFAVAEDGQDAIEQLEAGTFEPDVILLDLNMPRLSGRDFLRLRADKNLIPQARIAVFAATREIETLPGVSAWIRKPADMDVILSTIERI